MSTSFILYLYENVSFIDNTKCLNLRPFIKWSPGSILLLYASPSPGGQVLVSSCGQAAPLLRTLWHWNNTGREAGKGLGRSICTFLDWGFFSPLLLCTHRLKLMVALQKCLGSLVCPCMSTQKKCGVVKKTGIRIRLVCELLLHYLLRGSLAHLCWGKPHTDLIELFWGQMMIKTHFINHK